MEFPIIMRLFRRKTVGAAHGGITQLVEYPVHTRYVICSNQIAATKQRKHSFDCFLLFCKMNSVALSAKKMQRVKK